MNPLFRFELIREGRGMRLPMILVFYNSILAFLTILFMFFNAENLQEGIYYDTASYIYQFILLSTFQIVVVFVLMPFLVAGSYEEDYQTNVVSRLILIPEVSQKYVISKMCLAMCTSILLYISSLPIIALSCIYCGISLLKLFRLFIMICVFSFWCASIAVFFYTSLRKTSSAFFATITVQGLFLIGTLILEELIRSGTLMFGTTGEVGFSVTKLCMGLMALNPLSLYFGYYCNITGDAGILMTFCSRIGIDATDKLFSFVFYKVSMVLNIWVGLLFIFLAIWKLNKQTHDDRGVY